MADTDTHNPALGTTEPTAWWARFTLIGGLIALVLFGLGPAGYRLGILDVQPAVIFLPLSSASLAVITFFFALVGVILTVKRGLTAERPLVFAGGAVALVILLMFGAQFRAASSVPQIHDISTDPVNPPLFDKVVALRGENSNPLDYDAEALAGPTAEAYPWVKPLHTELSPGEAFARSLGLVESFGWEVVDADEAAGRIEATVTTFFYGFKDDIVIRIRPDAGGSVIDLRSVSRVGISDLGANANRIGAFITRFEEG